tara:strand:- start:31 stop:261 length:231 start_codon:yes stop_codon:yes gene_type:complete
MNWFYTHIFLAAIILWADHTNKLESAVMKIEKKLGIPVYYAPNDSVDFEINDPYPIENIPGQDTFNSQRNNNESRS